MGACLLVFVSVDRFCDRDGDITMQDAVTKFYKWVEIKIKVEFESGRGPSEGVCLYLFVSADRLCDRDGDIPVQEAVTKLYRCVEIKMKVEFENGRGPSKGCVFVSVTDFVTAMAI